MTLIVARILEPDHIRVYGDIRVTNSLGTSSYAEAALKVVILSTDLCVAYAGSVEPAVEAIRSISSDGAAASIAQELAAHPSSQAGVSDFLVAALRPASLVVVRHGAASYGGPATWIGDQTAYAKYQAAFHETSKPTADSGREGASSFEIAANQMHVAMKAVIDDPEIDSVGEMCVRAASDYGGEFQYPGKAAFTLGMSLKLSVRPRRICWPGE